MSSRHHHQLGGIQRQDGTGPRGATSLTLVLMIAALLGALGGVAFDASTVQAAVSETSSGNQGTVPAEPGQRVPTRGPIGPDPSTRQKVPLDLVGGLINGTPIFPGDFADPYLLAEPNALYIYATNTQTANIPVTQIQIGNILNGDYLGDALPDLPSWTAKGFQWAPSVWARPDDQFVMYYATAAPPPPAFEPRRMCISRAVANNPAGPFVDDSTGPMICPLSEGGAIDPSIFIDGSTPYLLWKSDGNCCNLPTNIYSQQLSPDGLSVVGEPSLLITNDQDWEGDVVEGPSMVKVGSTYELFYSANNWNSDDYAVGIALCETVTGPCTKPNDSAWMTSAKGYTGPGGQEFFSNPGGVWMVHHGFLPGQAGTPDGQRRLYLDLLKYTEGDPIPARIGTQEAVSKVLQFGAIVLAGLVLGGLAIVLAVRWRRRWRKRQHADLHAGASATAER